MTLKIKINCSQRQIKWKLNEVSGRSDKRDLKNF